jgi:hypothetical protein
MAKAHNKAARHIRIAARIMKRAAGNRARARKAAR